MAALRVVEERVVAGEYSSGEDSERVSAGMLGAVVSTLAVVLAADGSEVLPTRSETV